MEIDETSHVWLRLKFTEDVTRDDLADTYSFKHDLNADQEMVKNHVDHMTVCFRWQVRIKSADGECLFEDGHPDLRRAVHPDRIPWSGGPEKCRVAVNGIFYLKKEFRQQAFAKALYAAERVLYRKWGIREIQLYAADEGLVVWLKHFNFVPAKPTLLQRAYKNWASLKGEATPFPSNYADLPDAFLLNLRQLLLYKVLQ